MGYLHRQRSPFQKLLGVGFFCFHPLFVWVLVKATGQSSGENPLKGAKRYGRQFIEAFSRIGSKAYDHGIKQVSMSLLQYAMHDAGA